MRDEIVVVLPPEPPDWGLLPPALLRRVLARCVEMAAADRSEAAELPPPALLAASEALPAVVLAPLLELPPPAPTLPPAARYAHAHASTVSFGRRGRAYTMSFEKAS